MQNDYLRTHWDSFKWQTDRNWFIIWNWSYRCFKQRLSMQNQQRLAWLIFDHEAPEVFPVSLHRTLSPQTLTTEWFLWLSMFERVHENGVEVSIVPSLWWWRKAKRSLLALGGLLAGWSYSLQWRETCITSYNVHTCRGEVCLLTHWLCFGLLVDNLKLLVRLAYA